MTTSLNYVEQWQNNYQFRHNVSQRIQQWCFNYFFCQFDVHELLKIIHPTIKQLTSKNIAQLHRGLDSTIAELLWEVLKPAIAKHNKLSKFLVNNGNLFRHCHPLFKGLNEKDIWVYTSNWDTLKSHFLNQPKFNSRELEVIVKEYNRLIETMGDDFFVNLSTVIEYYKRYNHFENITQYQDVRRHIEENNIDTISFGSQNITLKRQIALYHFFEVEHLGEYPYSHILNVHEVYQKIPKQLWQLTRNTNKLENSTYIHWLNTLIQQPSYSILTHNLSIIENMIGDYFDIMDVYENTRLNKEISIANVIGSLTNTKSAIQYLQVINPSLEKCNLMKNLNEDGYLELLKFLDPHLKQCFSSSMQRNIDFAQRTLRNKIRIFEKIHPKQDIALDEIELVF